MNTSANIQNVRAVDVRLEEKMFYVQLEDGRQIGVPYTWFWRLAQATAEQRSKWRFIGGGAGIHWEEIDEDISVAGILNGNKNPSPPNSRKVQMES
jgi:hypothetical protein